MKYTGLLLLFISVIGLNAQYLKVQPEGLRSEMDNEKSYVVVTIDNKTAQELYTNAVKYIQRNYKNPEAVIKGNIENEFLSFSTYNPTLSKYEVLGTKIIECNYMTTIDFKDGKVKIEFIEKEFYYYADNIKHYFEIPYKSPMTGIGSIYNKKGVIKSSTETLAHDIEEYFNTRVTSLTNYLSNPESESENSSDDW